MKVVYIVFIETSAFSDASVEYHRTFSTFDAAEQYVLGKPGKTGSRQRVIMEDLPPEKSYPGYRRVLYNGYRIMSDRVCEGPTFMERIQEMTMDQLVTEMAKLSSMEKGPDRDERVAQLICTMHYLLPNDRKIKM